MGAAGAEAGDLTMATRKTQLDIETKGGIRTKKDLGDIGKTGERAFKRIEQSARPANRALTILSKTSLTLQRRMSVLVSPRGIAGLVGGNAGMGLLVRNALSAAEAINDVADRTGFAAERLQELRFAFDQNGVSMNVLDGGLRRFNRRVGLAADKLRGVSTEGGAAFNVFRTLGIEILDARNNVRATEAIFDDLVAALERSGSAAELSARASLAFGEDAGPAMAVLIGQGRAALDAYAKRARELGRVMDERLVRQGAAASAEMRALGQVMRTNFQAGLISGFIDEFGNFTEAVSDPRFQEGIRVLGESLGEVVRLIGTHGREVAAVLAGISAMTFTPGGPLVKGLAGAGAGIATLEALASESTRLNRELVKAEKMLGSLLAFDQGRRPGRVAREQVEMMGGIDKALDDTNRKIVLLRERLADLERARKGVTPLQDQGFVRPAPGVSPLRLTNEAAEKEREAALKVLADIEEARLRATDREVAAVRMRTNREIAALEKLRLTTEEKERAKVAIMETANEEIADIIDRRTQQQIDAFDQVETQGEKAFKRLSESIDAVGENFSRTVARMVLDGDRGFSAIGRSLAESLLTQGIQEGITGPLIGVGKSVLQGLFFGERGLAMDAGKVVPMARGGILDRPTVFPLRDGAAIASEYGQKEAVMPLKRMGSGNLGVEASVARPVVNVKIIGATGNPQVTETANAQGGVNIEVWLDQQMAENILEPTSRTHQAIGIMGGRLPITGR